MSRLTGSELLAEVEWLLDGGVHPLMVCQVLGRSAGSVEKAAYRLGRADVGRRFSSSQKLERDVAA